MSTRSALVVAIIMILAGTAAGAVASRYAPRPSFAPPPATSAPATSSASPVTPTADPARLVFTQPLSAGCATRDAVWVVSNGGGISRFAGDQWFLADSTLRTLVAAACAENELIAVGPSGRVLVADDRALTIRVEDTGVADLFGVAALPDGSALAAGEDGTVLLRSQGWARFARGIEERLYGVAFAGAASAWLVGEEGAAYRLEAPAGWRALPTGLALTLYGVAATTPDDAVAVGEDGALVRWRGGWTRLATGVTATLRGVARAGQVAYAAGDGGLAVRVDLDTEVVERIDLGTACRVLGVFTRAGEAWFIASQGNRAAIWRRSPAGLQRWGNC